MQQEEGEAAGAAQRQGDVRRRSHLLQQGHQVHIQAAVALLAGVSAHGDCWRASFDSFFSHPCALYYNLGLIINAAWQVWKYQATTLVADKALEQLNTMVQTPQGLRESRMLVTGSMNGSIR